MNQMMLMMTTQFAAGGGSTLKWDKVRRDLSRMLTPGSSLIVTDRSFARNTGLGTDFVVVTK